MRVSYYGAADLPASKLAAHQPLPARQSRDSCWPLRCADGRTFAQRAAEAGRRAG